jgi:glutathionyl-hydroquinone reductase
MGMLIDGTWTDEDRVIQSGAFVRAPSRFADDIPAEVIDAIAREPGRCHLIGSMSCPWSQRAMLVRALKGLERHVPLKIAGGPRVQGYALDGGRPWRPPGTTRDIVHLHELYALAEPGYTGRVTVPVLWDSREQVIVSNESAKIMRALDAVRAPGLTPFTLTPMDRIAEIDRLNIEIAQGLSEAAYRAGFAEAQAPYDAAVAEVFHRLDALEARLADRRYLLGAEISEADWRLFPSLVRFDAVYHVLFRCSRRRLIDYPNLWAYARDLFQWRGVAATVDFDEIRAGSYQNDRTTNPHGLVAIAPDADWFEPHGRDRLGPAQVADDAGRRTAVDPRTLRAPVPA